VVTSMFYHLQYLHLFRPFLKYAPSASPLPAHVSPRRICTAAAISISKLTRLYKKTYNLRQICNIAVYMEHYSCTIHLLNLPDKMAKRDIIHGVKHLEEIAEDWLCARRALSILSVLARKWKVELPDEAALTLQRSDAKYGTFNTWDVPSPAPSRQGMNGLASTPSPRPMSNSPPAVQSEQYSPPNPYAASPQQLPPDMSAAEIPADLLSSIGMSMQNGLPNPVVPASLSMDDALANWTMPVSTAQPGLSAFPTTTSIPAAAQQGPTAQAQQRKPSPLASLYAIDGEQWYIKDGVNWQQNFESWGLGGVPNAAAIAAASSARVNGQTSSPSSTGNPDPSMFMFRGLGLAEMDASTAFDGFGTNVGALDHLAGLE
jgi:hypothetical protein